MQDARHDYLAFDQFACYNIWNKIDRVRLDTDFAQLTFNIVY